MGLNITATPSDTQVDAIYNETVDLSVDSLLKPLCLVVYFTGSRNYPSRPSFSLSEGSSTLKIALFMAVFGRLVDWFVLA